MERIPVVSSNILSVGYDPESEVLEIEFNNHAIYQYFDINERIYEGLIGAASVGGYFASCIKGVYRFSKV
ncbi:KTSC domain-containing protein [Pseudomonas sp. URMO17WK12:I6]|jgi:hypothetical protein|uniref:KTSC domain-containing protein n=1 Tax=Pseudomonas sp. URMO17WK12:I6 TaxID=1261629 RepID=UPI000DAE6935|nr:KTSC domain-containing protein [Pseudomonas sp. URMO17WK12:I6]